MSLKSGPASTVRDLGQGHVIPHAAPPNWRGIWYPRGIDTDIRAYPHVMQKRASRSARPAQITRFGRNARGQADDLEGARLGDVISVDAGAGCPTGS